MNAVNTKVLLRFFPPVCTFAPSIFSQVGLTILWNTKGALIWSCCTFSLYSVVNFPFTVFQVNILIMVSLLGAHCYNAYCTLQGGQFNIDKWPNLQLHIVKSPFSHLHFYIENLISLHYFTGCPKCSDCSQKNLLIAQLFLKVFFAQTLLFGLFSFGVGGGACISGLPSYLLAYILTYIPTYLGYLSTYLPTYLGVDHYPHLPTI